MREAPTWDDTDEKRPERKRLLPFDPYLQDEHPNFYMDDSDEDEDEDESDYLSDEELEDEIEEFGDEDEDEDEEED